jgi:hypothetical protein
MAKIIDIENGRRADDNLICRKPLEFRRGDRRQRQALQCLRSEAEKYQSHRYRWRENEEQAREFYRLAGLMECVVNSTSPLLRTDLLRSLYKTIIDLRQSLNFSWRGDSSQFLLPLHPHFYRRSHFFDQVLKADTLKALYGAVKCETTVQFDLLAVEYVFYLPQRMVDEPA